MSDSLADLLRDWHEFYALAGAASATLVGLLFVTASIGSNVFKERHRASVKAFVTPTVVHFAAAPFTCLLAVIPSHSWRTLGSLLGLEGLAGMIYCGRILFQIAIRNNFTVDLDGRMFYALLPTTGYLMLLASTALLFMHSAASADVIAAALLTLLLAGIRNAWDMTIWIAVKPPPADGTPPSA